MSNYRDALKSTQSGGDTVKFERSYIDLKQSAFSYWDKEAEKRKSFITAIKGVVLGDAMRFSVWDEDNNSFLNSNYYTSKKDVALYQGSSLVMRGTLDEVSQKAFDMTTNRPKKQKVIWLATEKGVVELRSNLVLAISELNPISQDDMMDFVMEFTPELYDPEDKSISAKTKDYLGKFAPTNPPTFFRIKRSDPLNEEVAEVYGVIEKAKLLENWRDKWRENRHEEDRAVVDHSVDPISQQFGADRKVEVPVAEVEPDDLPF